MANGNDSGAEPQQESGFSIVNAISLLVVVGFLLAFATIQFVIPDGVKPEVLSIINILVGALVASFTTVVNYHIGSTKTSARSADTNRETIKSLANTAASTAATASTVANTAAVVAAAPAGGAPAAPTTVTTTTETKVAGAAEPKPAPGPVLDVAAEPTSPEIEAAIASLEAAAKDGIRSLDTAWATLSPMMQARTEFGYRALREAKVAELQGSNTPPKS